MVTFFVKLFSASGGVSSMRWVFLWTYLFAIVVPISSWAHVYVQNNGQGDIPAGVVTLVTLVIGAITTGKVLQSFSEGKEKGNVGPVEPAVKP